MQTLYGIELQGESGASVAIGTITEQTYQLLMGNAPQALTTRIEHRNGSKLVTIITEDAVYYELGRQLHRNELLIEALQA